MKPYRSLRSLPTVRTSIPTVYSLLPVSSVFVRYHSHNHGGGDHHHHSHSHHHPSSSSSASATSASTTVGKGSPSSTPIPVSSSASPKTLQFEEIRKHVRNGDYEAYLCGSLMPTSARITFFVLRSLNLELASIRDSARGNASTGKLRFAFWRDMIERAYKQNESSRQGSNRSLGSSSGGGGFSTGVEAHPLYPLLCQSIQQHQLTKRFLEYLIDIRETDLEESNQTVQSPQYRGNNPPTGSGTTASPIRNTTTESIDEAITSPSISASIETVENFGEKIYGSLLYLTLESLHIRNPDADEAAKYLGKALGIVTILRGLPVHARLGQRYLPSDLMKKYGITDHDLLIHPDEVYTHDGRPFIPETGTRDKDSTSTTDAKDTASIENRNRSMAITLARSNAGFGSAVQIQSVPSSSSSSSTPPTNTSSAPVSAKTSEKLSSSSGIRLAPSPAALRLANQKKAESSIRSVPNTAATQLSSSTQIADFLDFSSSASSTKATKSTRSASVDAAYAALRSGIGASQLHVRKSPETVRKVSLAVEELTIRAIQHIEQSRSYSDKLPSQASAALLPATTASRFLQQLKKHNYNIFDNDGGGLGPWQGKSNPWSKLGLQWELLWKTIQNRY